MNIDEILKYTRPSESYYDILGCHQSSSIEQINREYKIRALQLHPDKNQGSPESSLDEFRRLQTAKDVLTDESARRSYDCWLNSRLNIPFEQWRSRKGQSGLHWAVPRQTKLSIQNSSQGQGSDSTTSKSTSPPHASETLLEKFRNYEI